MSDLARLEIFEELASTLDIPDTAYEKAESRYADLGDWFGREGGHCSPHDPHIYPQGSFRLGTVIRPITDTDEYDLDVGCRLRSGITKPTHSQKQLKNLVGADLEAYRVARQIQNDLEPMHRCWRLQYQDKLSFHMDVVPSIPEDQGKRHLIKEAMIESGVDSTLAVSVANHIGAITDDRHDHYENISNDWKVSNSEGYARWFENRMKQAKVLMEKHAFEARAAQIDDLPARKWKSPLQRCVQILKRHRDVMFAESPDSKPISVIITTLSGRAYGGEQQLDEALEQILSNMDKFINPSFPRVPNPVSPNEDFADKWDDPKCSHLDLENNFTEWLKQARSDFGILAASRDVNVISEQAMTKFAAAIDENRLTKRIHRHSVTVTTSPKTHIIEDPARPWLEC